MKRKLLATVAIGAALVCMAGCGRGNVTAFKLAHFNGVSENGEMDSAYFYRNDFTLYGGDAQIIYVSEEQDETYGGYYYMYNSCCDGVVVQTVYDSQGNVDHRAAMSMFRSKDLSDWRRCGAVDNGFAVRLEKDDWAYDACWAPEVVYSAKDQKYFMYFSAEANPNALGEVEYDKKDHADGYAAKFDRFFLAVAVSDSPVGPFKLVTSENYYGDAEKANPNGKVLTTKNPQINFVYDNGAEGHFAAIDAHPYFDDVDSDGDGVNDFYLYFVNHKNSDRATDNSIWGMKMKDMVTPDYSTLRMLAYPNYKTVEYVGGGENVLDLDNYKLTGKFVDHAEYEAAEDKSNLVDKSLYGEEKFVNEGPFVIKEDGRYYLTYSPQGVGNIGYQVRQALGNAPLGQFEKPTLDPATLMGASDKNANMLGSGHHCFIDGGAGDLYCAYWPNANPMTNNIDETGRAYSVDRVHFTEDATYGKILCGGPTDSIQFKPYSYTGLVNVAPKATVSATNAVKGTEKYINDEQVVFRAYYAEREFAAEGSTTITLEFSKPTSVSAIMIYNSYDYFNAFKEIESILFYLDEKPTWYTAEEFVPVAGIFNLPFNSAYVDEESKNMNQGGSALASFKEIKVNKIEIKISSKISNDRDNMIKVSDIVVMGKGE